MEVRDLTVSMQGKKGKDKGKGRGGKREAVLEL